MSVEPGLIGFAALASLALGMGRHRPRTGFPLPSHAVARGLGWGLLCLSAAVAIAGFGAAIGVVAWIGQLSVAGSILVLLLSWRPATAPAALLLALACLPIVWWF